MELTADVLLLLGLVAVVAGFVDSVAGGGGLIAIPAMLLAGVPPIQAIATNKLQGSFGTATAALTMLRKNQITLHHRWVAFGLAALGGLVGTWLVQTVPSAQLDLLVPLVLTLIALYFLLQGKATDRNRSERISESSYQYLVLPGIGVYDGFFGPGAGSFYAATGVGLRGQNIVASTANAKLVNFASNLAALIGFVIGGKVLWSVGGVMIIGQICGAYIGSLAVIHVGGKLIRPLIVAVCLIMIARYGWQQGLFN